MSSEDSMELEDSLLQLLECPICFEFCQAPIFTCVNGHSLCSDCKETAKECPVCRIQGTPSVRSLALDTISEQLLILPCKFQSNGCGVKRKREEDLEMHYPNCKFQFVSNFKCLATTSCDFVGSRHRLYEHVVKDHSFIHSFMYTIGIRYKISTPIDYFHNGIIKWVEEEEEEYFWICSNHFATGKYMFYARYIGPVEKASTFRIHWKIALPDETKARLRIMMPPLTLAEDELLSEDTIVLKDSWFNFNSRHFSNSLFHCRRCYEDL